MYCWLLLQYSCAAYDWFCAPETHIIPKNYSYSGLGVKFSKFISKIGSKNDSDTLSWACFSLIVNEMFLHTDWTKRSIAWWLALNWFNITVFLNLTAIKLNSLHTFLSKLSDIIKINLLWHSLTLIFYYHFLNCSE